jgi:CRISPR-associated protein Cmr5
MSETVKSAIRTRDQERSELVYKNVRQVESKLQKEYKTLALSFPTLVRTCGLMQTIGFYQAKNKSHHREMLQHLSSELEALGFVVGDDLRATVERLPLPEYIHLTREVIGLGQWHKRFCQSLFEDEKEEESHAD